MGTYIFLTAIIIEIAIVVFCFITKSNQIKIRSIIRIVAFIAFVLLAILSIISWGFQYYALAALLLWLGVIGTITLIRNKQEKRSYTRVRIVFKALLITVLIFVVTLPAIIFPEHKALETTGQYQVATVKYTYTDTSRIETYTDTGKNRKLNVEFWYPGDYNESTQRTYPLIVFSHGGTGIKSSNESLYNELASHGFVVCSIDHTYQCLYTTDENGNTTLLDMGYMKELKAEDAKTDRQQSYEFYKKWMKIRTDDINLVIDNILAQAKKKDTDKVYKLVDNKKIGIIGHSLGGSAALGIGRIREDVSAVIALESPFIYDIVGVKDGEFVWKDEKYPIPVLNVYSDSAWSHLNEWPQYEENYTLLSDTSGAAFNVYIRGVRHFTLTDLSLTSPLITRILNGQKAMTDTKYCLETINKVCLEFFNCYLKGDGKFTSGGTY